MLFSINIASITSTVPGPKAVGPGPLLEEHAQVAADPAFRYLGSLPSSAPETSGPEESRHRQKVISGNVKEVQLIGRAVDTIKMAV